eukprot:COSAG06_NODE_9311_length_1931_cov_24.818231_4_plen_75_part_00
MRSIKKETVNSSGGSTDQYLESFIVWCVAAGRRTGGHPGRGRGGSGVQQQQQQQQHDIDDELDDELEDPPHEYE